MATPKLSDLEPDERNANKGTPRGQKQIVGSVQRNGAGRSGLLDKNNKIVAGNKSTEAFAEVFGEDVEPIIVETDGTRPVYVKRTDLDLDDPDPNNAARKLAYEDNLTSAFSFDLDLDVVALDIEAGFDFGEIDITPVDLAGLGVEVENGAGEDTEPQIDKAAELQEKWGTALGQLWQLGEHRLICGDCTDEGVVKRVVGNDKAKLFATDPPYGANAGNIGYTAQRDDIEAITKDDLEGVEMQAFLEAAFAACIPSLEQNCAWYLWHPMLTQGYFAAAAAAAAADLIIHRQIIWVKDQFIFGRGDYHWRHELCFYGWRKGNRPDWNEGRNQDTVWLVPYDGKRSEIGHPTAKPIELFAKPIRNHTKANDICLEPFCGSGSQIIACQNLSRQCRAVEISPGYVAVTLERFHQHSGIMPELIQGQT